MLQQHRSAGLINDEKSPGPCVSLPDSSTDTPAEFSSHLTPHWLLHNPAIFHVSWCVCVCVCVCVCGRGAYKCLFVSIIAAQNNYSWVDSTAKAVKVTLSERERNEGRQRERSSNKRKRGRRRGDKRHIKIDTEENGQSINDSVRAAPEDSSGVWCKKTSAESREEEMRSWTLYREDKRVKSTANAIIKEVISKPTN